MVATGSWKIAKSASPVSHAASRAGSATLVTMLSMVSWPTPFFFIRCSKNICGVEPLRNPNSFLPSSIFQLKLSILLRDTRKKPSVPIMPEKITGLSGNSLLKM